MRLRSLLATLILAAAAAPGQVALADLPALARARAERQRAAQEAVLQPFWNDLSLDHRINPEFVEGRIAAVAALGDSVVPILLDRLAPPANDPALRHLAGNCRRVLERLDPASFVDALLELAAGTNPVARSEALRLLGHVQAPRAVNALAAQLPTSQGEERLIVLESLRLQKAAAVADQVVGLLGSEERAVREAVLEYLIAARPSQSVDTVLQALTLEKEVRLLPLFVAYLAAAAPGNEQAANAMLPLLDRERLDRQDTIRLVQALGVVAPKGHEPTQNRLHAILDQEEIGPLGLEAALALQSLGDRKGLEQLHRNLNEQLKKAANRRDASLYVQRGDLYFAVEQWEKAKDDYENVLRYSQSSWLIRRARLMIARCEARRRRFTQVLEMLQQAAPSHEELLEMARTDPAMQEALQQDRIRAWLQTLKEKGGG